MDGSRENPIYVREADKYNSDPSTPEGKTFVEVESIVLFIGFILWFIGHYLL